MKTDLFSIRRLGRFFLAVCFRQSAQICGICARPILLLTFHHHAEARLVGCEWWQKMRQQLLCTEPVDSPGGTGLCPAIVLFEVTPFPAAAGYDMDHVVAVHLVISVS